MNSRGCEASDQAATVTAAPNGSAREFVDERVEQRGGGGAGGGKFETSDLLVIDCRAASTDLFIDFFDEVGLAEVLRTIDASLTVVCPVNHEADSVEQLRILSEAVTAGCRWVVLKNEAHSDSFKLYETSKTRRHLLARIFHTPCDEIGGSTVKIVIELALVP